VHSTFFLGLRLSLCYLDGSNVESPSPSDADKDDKDNEGFNCALAFSAQDDKVDSTLAFLVAGSPCSISFFLRVSSSSESACGSPFILDGSNVESPSPSPSDADEDNKFDSSFDLDVEDDMGDDFLRFLCFSFFWLFFRIFPIPS
jgi:hypothetical protein